MIHHLLNLKKINKKKHIKLNALKNSSNQYILYLPSSSGSGSNRCLADEAVEDEDPEAAAEVELLEVDADDDPPDVASDESFGCCSFLADFLPLPLTLKLLGPAPPAAS